MKLTDAQAHLEALVGEPVHSECLYQTRADLPGENQPVMLLGFTHDQQLKIGVVGAHTDPWVVAVPDWETTRRGRRERERDLIRLYTGRNS
jgi:hypothetical protein